MRTTIGLRATACFGVLVTGLLLGAAISGRAAPGRNVQGAPVMVTNLPLPVRGENGPLPVFLVNGLGGGGTNPSFTLAKVEVTNGAFPLQVNNVNYKYKALEDFEDLKRFARANSVPPVPSDQPFTTEMLLDWMGKYGWEFDPSGTVVPLDPAPGSTTTREGKILIRRYRKTGD